MELNPGLMATEQMMALDRVLGAIAVPDPEPTAWGQQVAVVAHQMRAVFRQHRDVIPPALGWLPGGGHGLRFQDRVLGIFRAGGIAASESVASLQLLWIIANGFSLDEARLSSSGLEPSMAAAVTEYFAALPADRFPNLVAAASEFAELNMDWRFDLLVNVFVDGLRNRRSGDLVNSPSPEAPRPPRGASPTLSQLSATEKDEADQP